MRRQTPSAVSEIVGSPLGVLNTSPWKCFRTLPGWPPCPLPSSSRTSPRLHLASPCATHLKRLREKRFWATDGERSPTARRWRRHLQPTFQPELGGVSENLEPVTAGTVITSSMQTTDLTRTTFFHHGFPRNECASSIAMVLALFKNHCLPPSNERRAWRKSDDFPVRRTSLLGAAKPIMNTGGGSKPVPD